MANLQTAALLVLLTGTAACSVLMSEDDDAMSSKYGELPLLDAGPGKGSKTDAGAEAAAEAPAAATRIFTSNAVLSVNDYPIAVSGGRVYFGFMKPGEASPGRIGSTRTDGVGFVSHYRGDFRPIRIQLDDLYLYASVQRDSDRYASVRKIAKQAECATGANCELDAVGATFAGAVAVTGDEVVWSHDKVVRIVKKGSTTRALAPTLSIVTDMRVDQVGNVFVLNDGMGGAGGVRRYNPGATALTPVKVVAAPIDFALGATEVFVLAKDGSILAYPKDGGDGRSVAQGLTGAHHLATDGKKLYVTRVPATGAPAIEVVPMDGSSPPAVLTSTETEPFSIAVDEGSVYWTDGTGSVWRVAK